MSAQSAPCQCWTQTPLTGHSGHCCFGDDPTPLDEIVPGQTPPCGHWHPDVARPA